MVSIGRRGRQAQPRRMNTTCPSIRRILELECPAWAFPMAKPDFAGVLDRLSADVEIKL
jgi:hypothetical protein|tara:strand:+ start:420 stop:596 length:177 start_codon:yes stop_codon:yes gene_type:complete